MGTKNIFDEKLVGLVHEFGFDDVMDAIGQMKKHYDNRVYVAAREMFVKTQEAQIQKGAAKYPEPLNPASWTVDQLAQHAFDELVDQSHYIKALQFKGRQLADQVEHFKAIAQTHGQVIADLGKEVRQLENDRNRWKDDCKEYAERLDKNNQILEDAAREIGKLTMENDELKKQLGIF